MGNLNIHDNMIKDMDQIDSNGIENIEKAKIVDIEAKKIIDELVNDSMSDLEKETAIHDYIVNNVVYEYNIENYDHNNDPDDLHNPYGALVNGIAVCDGYATAFNFLLKKIGIESYVVQGISPNWSDNPRSTIRHVWNIVKIDNKYYQVDVNWNDTSSKNNRDYFNKTDEDFASFGYLWCKDRYPKCE